MNGPPGGAVSKDFEHLKLLTTFHYILGAITAAWLSFGLIHFFIGLSMLLNPDSFGSNARQPFPLRLFGLLFAVIGGGVVLFGWTLGALTIYAGRCISRRERHLFCVVVACVNCLHMPLGTVLGVFTLIVLYRDSVRELFAGRAQASAPNPPEPFCRRFLIC